MDVILAGHNIDHEIIREIAVANPGRQDLTPETVAAAYARISRNPRPVNELRTRAHDGYDSHRGACLRPVISEIPQLRAMTSTPRATMIVPARRRGVMFS